MGAEHTPAEYPMQPIELDAHGVIRFRANPIVRFLLDEATSYVRDETLRRADDEADALHAALVAAGRRS